MVALKKTSLYLENSFLGLCILSAVESKGQREIFTTVYCRIGSMRVLTSSPFLQIFTFVILNAAISENTENGSGIFCQLIGTAFVNALTSHSRTHPLSLVAERALDTAAVGERFCVVGISHSETSCCARVPPGTSIRPVSLWRYLPPTSAIPALLSVLALTAAFSKNQTPFSHP